MRAQKPNWRGTSDRDCTTHMVSVQRRRCTNWKGKLGWTTQHLHHERKESGWNKKKGEELKKGSEQSGHEFNYSGYGKGTHLSDLYYLDMFLRL